MALPFRYPRDALLLLLLFLGLHIATSLIAVAALGAWWFFGTTMFQPFGTMMWGTLNNFLLVGLSSWARSWCGAA